MSLIFLVAARSNLKTRINEYELANTEETLTKLRDLRMSMCDMNHGHSERGECWHILNNWLNIHFY